MYEDMGFSEDDRIRAKNNRWKKYQERDLFDMVILALKRLFAAKPEGEKDEDS